MAEDRSKILSKAKKLHELAVRGVDGEMDNAKKMLAIYMEKHNITQEEINGYSSNDYSNSNLSSMTDEEFIKEMITELIPVGIGALFARFANPEMKSKIGDDSVKFINKYLNEIIFRANKMNAKNNTNKTENKENKPTQQ